MATPSVCKIDGCDKGGKIRRGWCSYHYLRWYAHGDPEPKGLRRVRGPGPCEVVGCSNVGKLTRGWCDMHYQRWQAHRDPLVSKCDREWRGLPCIRPGCGKPVKAKRLCEVHYTQRRLAPVRLVRAKRHAAILPISDTDAAYIAGMIDADGMISASVHRASVAQPLVCVTNGNFGLIEWLLACIGAGCTYEQKSVPTRADQDRSRWNTVHRYQITGRKAQTLLERCRPYFKVKARQAELVIAIPQRGRDFPLSSSADQKAFGMGCVAKIRALNARGRKSDNVVA